MVRVIYLSPEALRDLANAFHRNDRANAIDIESDGEITWCECSYNHTNHKQYLIEHPEPRTLVSFISRNQLPSRQR